jgi:hypothetical protein
MLSFCDSITSTRSGGNGQFRMGVDGGRPTMAFYCSAVGGTDTGFIVSGSSIIIGSVSANNSGATSDGITLNLNQGISVAVGNTCRGNGRDGLRFSGSTYQALLAVLNVSYGNSAYGLNFSTAPTGWVAVIDGNAYGSNTSGNLNNITAGPHDVVLTADPHVSGAGSTPNLTLNATAGGGAAIRGMGIPGGMLIGGVSYTGYVDPGALQHQDSPAVIIAMTQQIYLQEK